MGALFCKQCGVPILELKESGLCFGCEELKKKPDGLSRRQFLGRTPFKDMKQMDEYRRIDFICSYITNNPGKDITVLVDKSPEYQGKGDRYIEKVKEKVPNVRIKKRFDGPARGCESIIFILDK